MDAKPQELVGDGVAEPGLQRVVTFCHRRAGDDEDAQGQAVLNALELVHLRVAGEQGELQGMDGDPAAVAGGKREDVVGAAVDSGGANQRAPAWAGVGVKGDQVGHLQPEQRLDQVVQVGDQQSGAGLTSGDRLAPGADDPAGPLGPIWRDPWDPTRRPWPPPAASTRPTGDDERV